MLEFLPEDIRKGLLMASDRQLRRSSRLSVHVGDAVFPLLRLWEGGFAVDSGRTPRLRGLVDLYDGPRHISQCLIVAVADEGGTMVYEFKRETAVTDRAPRDYDLGEGEAPGGLLPRPA
jgi:hypothetical protein